MNRNIVILCYAISFFHTSHTLCKHFSIDKDIFNFICNHVPANSTILELGSGEATGRLAKHYHMVSIENSAQWLNKYDSIYIHAPLKEDWYDVSILRKELPKHNYQAILIDGPNGYYSRFGFYTFLNLFNTNVPIFFDDVHVARALRIVEAVATELKRPYQKIGKYGAVIFP